MKDLKMSLQRMQDGATIWQPAMGSKEAPPAPPQAMLPGEELLGRQVHDPFLCGHDLHGAVVASMLSQVAAMAIFHLMNLQVEPMVAGEVLTILLRFHCHGMKGQPMAKQSLPNFRQTPLRSSLVIGWRSVAPSFGTSPGQCQVVEPDFAGGSMFL